MLNRIELEFQTYMDWFKFGILLEFVSFHWNRWIHCHSIGWFSLLNQKDDFSDSEKSFAMLLKSSFQSLKVFQPIAYPCMIHFISSFSKARIQRVSSFFKYPDNFYTEFLSLLSFASKEFCEINDNRIITGHFQTNGRKSSEVSGCFHIWAHNHLQSSTKMHTKLRFTFMACTIIVWLFST